MTAQPLRPAATDRCFHSDAVESVIDRVSAKIPHEELARMFSCCFPNTLDTTVFTGRRDAHPDTFVITGDIPAMWLRDSTAQVWPYLRLIREDSALQRLVAGLIRRQTHCIAIDPYANAFLRQPGDHSEWATDHTEMKPGVHERKWEIDSLCYFLRLSHGYWKSTGDPAPFDPGWQQAVEAVVSTFREQQRSPADASAYVFERTTRRATDTLTLDGRGTPSRPCGLIRSAFRPSDDATTLPYLIPSNFFAVAALRGAAEILETLPGELHASCTTLADEVEHAIRENAIFPHAKCGPVLAYEIDGFGSALFMDDSNVPSLLSLPYLGCLERADPLYQNTRRLVLGPDNPYFFTGFHAAGVGSPHTGYDMIWPMSIILRALTSDDDAEILDCLQTLVRTHAGTHFMHESFHKDDPARFTRKWFAWANTLFGELILTLSETRPALLKSFTG